jgi:hypothetical protein
MSERQELPDNKALLFFFTDRSLFLLIARMEAVQLKLAKHEASFAPQKEIGGFKEFGH